MEQLFTTQSIARLKTPVLLRMRREYLAAFRYLPGDDPAYSGSRAKLDSALELIESQLRTRGIELEPRETGTETATI